MERQEFHFSQIDWSAKPGFYITEGSIRFWVFDSFRGRYAVRLDGSPEGSQFSGYKLGWDVITAGAWLGPVKVAWGPEVLNSFRGRVGVMGTGGLRWFLKALGDQGRPIRIPVLPSDLGTPQRHTSLHPNWKLYLESEPSKICVFESPPEPPKVGKPEPQTRPDPKLRLIWSAPDEGASA